MTPAALIGYYPPLPKGPRADQPPLGRTEHPTHLRLKSSRSPLLTGSPDGTTQIPTNTFSVSEYKEEGEEGFANWVGRAKDSMRIWER